MCTATDWDARVDRALSLAPPRLGAAIAWLRQPSRRWVRLIAGLLLILGGIFSILPILGLWMLPLGLALIGEDFPSVKPRLERVTRWLKRAWVRLRW